MKLIVATHNPNKVREIGEILPGWEIVAEDSAVEETENTFAGNALLKARALAPRHPGAWLLADDSGLEVFALDGAPGVRSARYAGEDGNSAKNNALLLKNLEGVSDRGARFTCAVALVAPDGTEHVVEGHCPGTILTELHGAGGFGYDPLFVPEGFDKTFAELSAAEKNAVSHRGRALAEVAKTMERLKRSDMEIRYTVGRNEMKRMTTAELRAAFMNTELYMPGEVRLMYCEVERGIAGFAVPLGSPLSLPGGKEIASAYFCERRELGVLNTGAKGTVTVDGTIYKLEPREVLYVGKGAKDVRFESADAEHPAIFYLVSYPAHTAYPTKLIRFEDANHRHLGTKEDCNLRTIHQFILPGKCESCQLVMGYTELEPGSNWNTMPAHTHERRTEIYMYFDIPEDAAVFHFMGPGDETRHLAVHDRDVVVSPMWSIHAGVGTRAYTFCWAMGGENQVFDDMDGIAVEALR